MIKRIMIFSIVMVYMLSMVAAIDYTEQSSVYDGIENFDKISNNLSDRLKANYTDLKEKSTNQLLILYDNSTDETSDKLDKSRPIYFAMDHVNWDDEKIRDTIVNKLKSEGFTVVTAEIGPNEMSKNTIYLYENNVTDAVIFHLFNGVDPSTIRELATNGTDNRGRVVRENGNDVVLAWFYDSVDCVNDNGSAIHFVYGSETGPRLDEPQQYMKDNDIYAICTSSDGGLHNQTADYTGEKTAEEFIKLFE